MLVSCSQSSLGTTIILDGAGVAAVPSSPASAPKPPAEKYRVANSRPSRRCPITLSRFIIPGSPWTRSGSASAMAPNTSGAMKWPIMKRAPVEAGGRQFRIDPSGADSSTGLTEPSLFGMSGSSRHLIAKQVIARV